MQAHLQNRTKVFPSESTESSYCHSPFFLVAEVICLDLSWVWAAKLLSVNLSSKSVLPVSNPKRFPNPWYLIFQVHEVTISFCFSISAKSASQSSYYLQNIFSSFCLSIKSTSHILFHLGQSEHWCQETRWLNKLQWMCIDYTHLHGLV